MANGSNDIDNDAEDDEQNADWQRKTGVRRFDGSLGCSNFAQEQTKPRHDKTETHQRDARPKPRQKRALRGQVNARVALGTS